MSRLALQVRELEESKSHVHSLLKSIHKLKSEITSMQIGHNSLIESAESGTEVSFDLTTTKNTTNFLSRLQLTIGNFVSHIEE